MGACERSSKRSFEFELCEASASHYGLLGVDAMSGCHEYDNVAITATNRDHDTQRTTAAALLSIRKRHYHNNTLLLYPLIAVITAQRQRRPRNRTGSIPHLYQSINQSSKRGLRTVVYSFD